MHAVPPGAKHSSFLRISVFVRRHSALRAAMRRPNPILATGTLLSRTGERTWVTALPNGATTLAHVPTWKLDTMPAFAAGDKVRLEMTQYDFSIARIAGKTGA